MVRRKTIEEILFQDDVCEKPYMILKEKQQKFAQLLEVLKELEKKGVCTFTSDKPQVPMRLHCAFVEWKEEAGMCEIGKRDLEKLLKLSDGFLVDYSSKSWTFSVEVCVERNW